MAVAAKRRAPARKAAKKRAPARKAAKKRAPADGASVFPGATYMDIALDAVAVRAAFSQPDPDGVFHGAFGEYLHDLGQRRPVVMFAFAPKAAGTFLRRSDD